MSWTFAYLSLYRSCHLGIGSLSISSVWCIQVTPPVWWSPAHAGLPAPLRYSKNKSFFGHNKKNTSPNTTWRALLSIESLQSNWHLKFQSFKGFRLSAPWDPKHSRHPEPRPSHLTPLVCATPPATKKHGGNGGTEDSSTREQVHIQA